MSLWSEWCPCGVIVLNGKRAFSEYFLFVVSICFFLMLIGL